MPSSDGARDHTRGAVFSMEYLIGADAFRLWLTARGVTSIHAGSHQTTRPVRAGNIAVGVKPTDPRLFRTLHARSQTAKPSRTERYKPKQAPPSHGSASSTGTTFASSTKHAHGNTKASETKAHQPRVPRGREGVTLGILRPLGSGYEFQGWLS